jgi:release factor glutamine methyltransferase
MEAKSGRGAQLRSSDWYQAARRRLLQTRPAAGDETPDQAARQAGLDAQLLLAYTLQKPRAWVLAHPEFLLSEQQQAGLEAHLRALVAGVPLPYLLGRWEFYGLEMLVTPNVLIPRPETELMVDLAINWLHENPACRRGADVGTGSGCIAITLAYRIPDLHVLAVDRSQQALDVARKNATAHGVSGRIGFFQGSLLSAVQGPLDLVCANLPYIPSVSLAQLPVARHEPRMALDGGADGLDLIRDLLKDAPRWLARGGLLLLEIQFDQGLQVGQLAQLYLPGAQVRVHHDLAGLPRTVAIENAAENK